MSEKSGKALATAAPPGRAVRPGDLTVVLRREKDGPEIGREPVCDADLADVFSEMWLDRWLGRGLPEVPFESLRLRILPEGSASDAGRCGRFTFEAVDPLSRSARRQYALEVFQDVAVRGSQRLLASGVLKANDLYYYEVAVDGRARDGGPGPFKVTARHPPLVCQEYPFERLVKRARRTGDCGDRWLPVFFTRQALEAAERLSRRGAACRPPVETGCVLAGPLVSCPHSGRLAAVVVDSLDLVAAEGTSFSLLYGADTWRRLQAVMRAKQAQPATRAHRILGQAHGHNFRPSLNAGEGENTCQDCPKLAACRLTSVFVSQDDRAWSRAVFSRQPWQMALIFGHDARGENTHALYGLRDNRLAERGYYVIEEFPPEPTP